MRFFDLLYYLVYTFYSAFEKGAESTAASIVGGMQAINVASLMMAVAYNFGLEVLANKLAMIAVAILFQVVNYVRYNYQEKHSIQVIEQIWESKSPDSRKLIKSWAIFYSITSIVVFLGIAIYLGTKRHSV